jgi:hypothetical protein
MDLGLLAGDSVRGDSMLIRKNWLFSTFALVGLAGTGSAARAAYVVTLQQVGANVVATGSGSIDLADLSEAGNFSSHSSLEADDSALNVGPSPNNTAITLYQGTVSGPSNFGPGFNDENISSSSGNGDFTGIYGQSDGAVNVPDGYLSGEALAGNATWSGTTLAGLGVTQGTYVWTWGTGVNTDSFTLNVVPEPSSCVLIGTASAALLMRRRRRGIAC